MEISSTASLKARLNTVSVFIRAGTLYVYLSIKNNLTIAVDKWSFMEKKLIAQYPEKRRPGAYGDDRKQRFLSIRNMTRAMWRKRRPNVRKRLPLPGSAATGEATAVSLALRLLSVGPLLILILLVAAISQLTPNFLKPVNIGNILAQTAVIAIVAIGQQLVILTRGIDLSVGANLALATVIGGLVFRSRQFRARSWCWRCWPPRRSSARSTASSTSTGACRIPSSSRSRR